MRHLIKKNVKQIKGNKDLNTIIKNTPINSSKINEIISNKLEEHYVIGITEENEIFQFFKHHEKDNIYLVPEIDPTVLYFDTALQNSNSLQKIRLQLFNNSKKQTQNIYHLDSKMFYQFYSIISTCTLFLFLSIEAFVNKLIPNDYQYIKKGKTPQTFNKYEIQRNIPFNEKLKTVIPEITKKEFVKEFGHKYELINNLKKFRDDIVHTKSFSDKCKPNYYEKLYSDSLKFNFDKSLEAVKDFINFHEEGLIEECDCNH